MEGRMRETDRPGMYDGNRIVGRRRSIRLIIELTDAILTVYTWNAPTQYGELGRQRFIQLAADQIEAVCLRPSAFALTLAIEVLWRDPFGQDHQFIFGTRKAQKWLEAFEASGANVVRHPSPMKPWRPTSTPAMLLADVDVEQIKGSLPAVPLLPPIELHESHYKLLRLVVIVLVLALIVVAAS